MKLTPPFENLLKVGISPSTVLGYWQMTTDLTMLNAGAIGEFSNETGISEDRVMEYVFVHETDHRSFFHCVPLQLVSGANARLCRSFSGFGADLSYENKEAMLEDAIVRKLNFIDIVPLLEAIALYNAQGSPRYHVIAERLTASLTESAVSETLDYLIRLSQLSGSRRLPQLLIYLSLQSIGIKNPDSENPETESRLTCFQRLAHAFTDLLEDEALPETGEVQDFLWDEEVSHQTIGDAASVLAETLRDKTGIRFIHIEPEGNSRPLWTMVQKRTYTEKAPPGRGPETSALIVESSGQLLNNAKLKYRPDLSTEERGACTVHLTTSHLVDEILADKVPTCPLGRWAVCKPDCDTPCEPFVEKALALKRAYDGIHCGPLEDEWVRTRGLRPI